MNNEIFMKEATPKDWMWNIGRNLFIATIIIFFSVGNQIGSHKPKMGFLNAFSYSAGLEKVDIKKINMDDSICTTNTNYNDLCQNSPILTNTSKSSAILSFFIYFGFILCLAAEIHNLFKNFSINTSYKNSFEISKIIVFAAVSFLWQPLLFGSNYFSFFEYVKYVILPYLS